MGCYVGLDLHSNNTYIGIMDEEERRLFKGRYPNQLDVLLEVLQPFKEEVEGVVVESTFNWYWLVDGLQENGYRVHLGHPPAFPMYRGLKYTDDEHDAFFLARMLKMGTLPEGHILENEERQLRDLLRKRLQLVRQRTQNILSFKSLVNRNLGKSIDSNAIKRLKEEDIDGMFRNPHLVLSAKATITNIRNLKSLIVELEKAALPDVSATTPYDLLLTVPGIGKALGMIIALETGPVSRFRTPGDYVAYCRLVPTQRLSNDKVKGKGNSKNGNKYLCWAFVEAANKMRRYCPQAQAYFTRKTIKSNCKALATKALAHKIARACFYVMRDQVPFDVVKIFGPMALPKKGRVGEPDRGLDIKPLAPIGKSDAAVLPR